MQGQSSGSAGSPPRYRMHYVQMTVPKQLKCYTCGLCGDFVIRSTGFQTEAMEACDGTLIDYRAGWKFPSTPEAFDTYGWTWEKLYTDNECSNNYDNTDNMLRNEPIVDACDAAIEQQVINECDNAIAAQQTCCDKIGNGFCDGLKQDCYIDACAGANGDVTAIDDEIQNIIIDPIVAVCNNDDLIDNEPVPDPLDFSCVVRNGNRVQTIGAISSASCQSGEVLASCGVAGVHLLEGTYIDPAEPNKCQAQTMSASYAVTAKAVCCTFTGVTATVSTVTSTTMNGNSQVITQCPAGSSVTGCQVNIESGGQYVDSGNGKGGDLRGAYAGSNQGKATAPLSSGTTNNQCVAESQAPETETTIRGGSQCITLSDGYELECVAASQLTNKDNFDGNCPDEYKLVGCMTYTLVATLDAWYYNGNGCYVQQDSHQNQYANGICCRLAQTALPLAQQQSNHIMHNIRDEETNQTYYFETFGIIGLVLTLCGGALYWRKNKKFDGYQVLKGIDSEEMSPFLKDNRV